MRPERLQKPIVLTPAQKFSQNFNELHNEFNEKAISIAQLVRKVNYLEAQYKKDLKIKERNGKWPEDRAFIKNGPKWLIAKCMQYQYLMPIFCHINEYHLSLYKSKKIRINKDDQSELKSVHKNSVCYAFVDSDWEAMADSIGCSVPRLKKHLTALAKVGLLKEFNRGKAGRFFAYGYWLEYYCNDKGSKSQRIIKFLNSKTVRNLKDFEVP